VRDAIPTGSAPKRFIRLRATTPWRVLIPDSEDGTAKCAKNAKKEHLVGLRV
jgi:hypothetical protein